MCLSTRRSCTIRRTRKQRSPPLSERLRRDIVLVWWISCSSSIEQFDFDCQFREVGFSRKKNSISATEFLSVSCKSDFSVLDEDVLKTNRLKFAWGPRESCVPWFRWFPSNVWIGSSTICCSSKIEGWMIDHADRPLTNFYLSVDLKINESEALLYFCYELFGSSQWQ